jgi:murein DD-endopeptidase MepM/ murein hydrolase activator NlpD
MTKETPGHNSEATEAAKPSVERERISHDEAELAKAALKAKEKLQGNADGDPDAALAEALGALPDTPEAKAKAEKIKAIREHTSGKTGEDFWESLGKLLEDIMSAFQTGGGADKSSKKKSKKEKKAARKGKEVAPSSQRGFMFPSNINPRISSGYGPRTHPITHEKAKMHNGVDIGGLPAGTKILLPPESAGAKVITVTSKELDGNYIIIELTNGDRLSFSHLQKLPPWKKGDVLNAGDTIGLVGSTGSSTAPHVHVGLRRKGVRADPTSYCQFD